MPGLRAARSSATATTGHHCAAAGQETLIEVRVEAKGPAHPYSQLGGAVGFSVRSSAPRLGEDTDAVLAELGLAGRLVTLDALHCQSAHSKPPPRPDAT